MKLTRCAECKNQRMHLFVIKHLAQTSTLKTTTHYKALCMVCFAKEGLKLDPKTLPKELWELAK
jgi:hypothetical protein